MILVLNGPNLNLLGEREPERYGHTTLAELERRCGEVAAKLGSSAVCRQSNHEGELIDWLHGAKREGFSGVVMNPGGLSHTSVALRDAIAAISLPVVEVHISNVLAREPFRHVSMTGAACLGSVIGLGVNGYSLAIRQLLASD